MTIFEDKYISVIFLPPPPQGLDNKKGMLSFEMKKRTLSYAIHASIRF